MRKKLRILVLVCLATACSAAAQNGAQDVTIAAAGDISCAPGQAVSRNFCRMEDTARLIEQAAPDAVLMLGDGQYVRGELAEYQASYDRSWGRFIDITYPVPGNHEYWTRGAAGYFAYFGERAGIPGRAWYAFDLGGWRIYALDSNCEIVGCEPGSAQYEWLRSELTNDGSRCSLAFFHHPRFSSGPHGNNLLIAPFWELLDSHGVDILLTAHDHHYERFAPMTSLGSRVEPNGLRQFVVGTGGAQHYGLAEPAPQSEVAFTGTFGVLLLTLGESAYAWQFVPVESSDPQAADSGAASCR